MTSQHKNYNPGPGVTPRLHLVTRVQQPERLIKYNIFLGAIEAACVKLAFVQYYFMEMRVPLDP